jgi:hypothetical protein
VKKADDRIRTRLVVGERAAANEKTQGKRRGCRYTLERKPTKHKDKAGRSGLKRAKDIAGNDRAAEVSPAVMIGG